MTENTTFVYLKGAEAFLNQSLGHRVKKRNKMVQREDAEGSCKANDHDCWWRKGESSLRRAADV